MTLKDTMADDLATFVNPNEFGTQVLFSRSGENINVLLDNDMESETGRYVDYITAKVSDVENVAAGDTFTTTQSVVYYVTASEPVQIGDGMIMMRVDK